MKLWMYYETDGDSGYYHIKLFKYKENAEAYKEKEHDAYGKIDEVEVDETKSPMPENVKCPECEGPMISRTGKYGVFWGCKKFPDCRGTRDSMGRSKAERDAERGVSDSGVEPSAVDRIADNDRFRFRKS